jgi:hypothetical protein
VRRRRHTLPRIDGSIVVLAIVAATSVAAVFVAGESRAIVLPILALLVCAVAYGVVLYRRDGGLPVFEPASFAVAATVVYGAYPLVNFIAGGLAWSPYADNRLFVLAGDPAEVAAFGWRYAMYLVVFVFVYLLLRGKSGVRTTAMRRPSRATRAAIVLVAVLSWGLLATVARVYGIQYSPSYAEAATGSVRGISSLPLFVAQITQNVESVQLLLLQFVVALLMIEWRRHAWAPFVLIGLLLFFTVDVVVTRGSRSALVLLLLATGLLYHRLVRPMKLVAVTAAGMALLIGVLGYGIVRDFRNYREPVAFLTAANEFQSILGTPFDLQDRMRAGELVNIPWQIYWADLLALVPSQLLPFEKIDPSLWYLQIAGIREGGYVFGLLAQAVVGYDWVELVLRGTVLALVLALLQRWYARHMESFWATMLMMFLSLWMYYTIRQSTFSFLYFLVYRFVPTVFVVQGLSYLLARASRPARRSQAAAH